MSGLIFAGVNAPSFGCAEQICFALTLTNFVKIVKYIHLIRVMDREPISKLG
jgi:hypothetical protein